jgi:hypothetical protein
MKASSTWKVKNGENEFTYFFEIDGESLSGYGIAVSKDTVRNIKGTYKDHKIDWNEYSQEEEDVILGVFEA